MTDTSLEGTPKTCHPSELNLFHKNPRIGNVDVIKGSLRAHSQYKPILVNKGTHTGRPNEVLAGNHTLKAIRDLAEEHPEDERWQTVHVWEIDVDDDRASRIVVADNRTAELGGTDEEVLAGLLEEMMQQEAELEGTGYDNEDLEYLLGQLNESGARDAIDAAFPEQDFTEDDDISEDDDEDDEDDDDPSMLTCPECGHQWEPTEAEEEIILPQSPDEAGDH